MDSQQGGVCADLTDLRRNNLKLLLEGSGLRPDLELLHDFSEGRVIADHDDEHLAVTASD